MSSKFSVLRKEKKKKKVKVKWPFICSVLSRQNILPKATEVKQEYQLDLYCILNGCGDLWNILLQIEYFFL